MLQDLSIKIGASPINWWDGFPIPEKYKPTNDEMLSEMKEAGYAGTEMGGTLPSDPSQLTPLLQKYELELVGGWYGANLLSQPLQDEKTRFSAHLAALKQMGAPLAIIGENTHVPIGTPFSDRPHHEGLASSLFPYDLPFMRDEQWRRLADGLEAFQELAERQRIKTAYHPHMQTLVQDFWQIERLIEEAPFLQLCMDTGHLAFAGMNAADMIAKHIDRTVHLHLKNIRTDVVARAKAEPTPWEWAKIGGAFTVPGDGGIDFLPIFKTILEAGYSGWIVLEAEQNSLTSNPYLYAKLGREYIRQVAGI